MTDATIRRWCGPAMADCRFAPHAGSRSDGRVTGRKPSGIGRRSSDQRDVDLTFQPARCRGVSTHQARRHVHHVWPSVEFHDAHRGAFRSQTSPRGSRRLHTLARHTCQNNWRQFFDPITIRFSISREQLAAEITVMPLILGTDYREIIGGQRRGTHRPDGRRPAYQFPAA